MVERSLFTLQNELFKVPEILFNPSLLEDSVVLEDTKGIHEHACDSIRVSDVNIQPILSVGPGSYQFASLPEPFKSSLTYQNNESLEAGEINDMFD